MKKEIAVFIGAVSFIVAISFFILYFFSFEQKYKRGCENGNVSKCYYLGNIYFDNTETSKQNIKKSIFFLKKGCEFSHHESCLALNYLYLKGYKSSTHQQEAIKYFDKLCQSDDLEACFSIASRFFTGEDILENRQKALIYFDKLCKSDYKNSCLISAVLYDNDLILKNENRALISYQKACEKDEFIACYNEANIYISAFQQNITKAIPLLKKSCEKGDIVDSCYVLGHLLSSQIGHKNYSGAIRYYEKACLLDTSKCNNLAVIYSTGRGNIPKNTQKALDLYKRSCELNDTIACNNIGIIYDFAKGVEQDLNLAKNYYSKACNSGYQKACESLNDVVKKIEK